MHYKKLLLTEYLTIHLDRLNIKISFAIFPHLKPTKDKPFDY